MRVPSFTVTWHFCVLLQHDRCSGDHECFPFVNSAGSATQTPADTTPARWPDTQKGEKNNVLGQVDDSGWREEGGMRINIYDFIL